MSSEINIDQLHSFFDLSSEMMAVLTEDGCFSQTNPAWQRNLGFTPRDLKDSPYFDLLHPEDLSRAQVEIQKLHQGVPRVEFTGRCRAKGGDYRWVSWSCRLNETQDGFFLLGHDNTDLQRAETALEESLAKFKRLSDSAQEGIAIHDNGIIVEANQALATMMGYEHPEELIGLDGLKFPAPEYRPLAQENVKRGFDQPYESVFQRKDGSRFTGMVYGKPIQHMGRAMRVTTFIDITHLKRREQELFESQDFARKMIEASRDGIAVSEKGVILMANSSLARMFGHQVSEMIGHNALEFTAPEFRETLLKKVLDEVEATYEVIGLKKDGSRFPVEISPRMTTYQGRRVRVAFFHDITQRKKIEEEVLHQKEFNQNLINSSKDGLLAFDHECRYTLWNPAMERISGHSREEALGQRAFDVFPFLKQIGEDRYFHEALKGRSTVTEDRPYRTPAGQQGYFTASYSPLKNSRGEIIGGLGIIHETTDRKRVEVALQESETNLRAVFHNTFQNIILMDREGRIKAFNPNAAAAILEETGKDLEVGRDLAEYFHPENVQFFRKNLQQVLDGEAVQLERPLPVGEGEVHWFEVNYHPVFGAAGEIEGVCLTSLDIDDRKQVQEALRKSEADLRAVFNSSSWGFILAGRNGKIRDFNQLAQEGVRRMRGQELEVGRALSDYIEPEYVKVFKERFKKVLQGETLRLERIVQSPMGKPEWFEFTYNPVCDPQGKVIGVCAAIGSIQKRKDAEEKILKSENQLRTLFNSVQQGIVLMDPRGIVQNFNKTAGEIFQAATGREFKAGSPFLDYVREEDREEARGRLERVCRGERVHLERPYLFADGSRHWVEFTYHPVLDAEGAITGICFISQSIDDRKKAEEALKDSEEKFRRVFENAPLGMTLMDKDFRFLHANRTFCQMTGYEAGELAGKKFAEITHPDDLYQNIVLAGDLSKGRGFRMQKRYLHKDGRIVWANLTVQSFLSAQGEFLYSLGMVEDITEHKRAEAALQESEEKFRRIFEDASMAMAMVNDYKFLKANRAFQELLGYPEGEIVGKTLFDITHPEDLKQTKEIAGKVHSQEVDRFSTEKRYLKKNGESLWAHVSGTLIRNSRGEKMYSLIIIENITDRKKAQEALQKSEAELKAVFNSGSQVVVLIAPDGSIQNFNQSADFMARRILGAPLQKGIPFIKTLPPGADPEIFTASFKAALEGRESQGERCIRSAEGKERWVEVKYQPVPDTQGEVQGVCFSLSFIDERKKAEEALRESQERFQRFTELTREGILIHENPTVTDVNPALAAMMGYPAGEMIGKNGFDFIAPESREEARRRMQEGSVAPYEILALRKDGSTFPAELHGRNYQDKGRTLRVMSVRDLTWQKAAERILTESEERYRKLVELLPEAIVVHAAGRILYVNSTGLRMFAATPDQVDGSSLAEFLHPDHRDEALARVQEILQSGRSTDWIEQKLIRKNGEVFDAETKGTPILYQGIPAVMTIARDITERKKSESALRESEKDYRRLVAEIPLSMVVIGEGGVIVSANAASARLLGAHRISDLIGQPLFDFILPENMAIVRQRVEKVLGERVDTENRETELRTLTGARVQVEVRGIPITFQGRKLALSILRDVTESKKAEKSLRESEQLYRHLVEAIPLAIMVVGDGMRVVSVNAEAAKLFKAARPEDLMGRDALDFVLPENRETVKERLRRTLEEDSDAPTRETELLGLHGERVEVEASAIPFTYQGRKCALSIFRDIAESKRVSQMLLRYERLAAVGKVIAAIAHEVRNPLAVVSGMSQILKAKLETRSEYSQELDTILTQAGRLKFFMNDILDYSRSMEIHKAPVNPRILFEECLLLAQAQLGGAQALTHVEWRMEEGLPDFLADADRLQQVLVNLILNAYQALDGRGTVILSAKIKDGWVILGVEDDGPGIPEADMTRIFEPFFTTKKQGSGLGLSISQKIAEAHGGRIAIKRLSPHGSYFALQIPLEPAE